jgi:hypothetical protein
MMLPYIEDIENALVHIPISMLTKFCTVGVYAIRVQSHWELMFELSAAQIQCCPVCPDHPGGYG